MTVWASSVVVNEFNVENSDADAGPFSTVGGNGANAVPNQPILGYYPIGTTGGGSGGTIAGQAAGFSIA